MTASFLAIFLSQVPTASGAADGIAAASLVPYQARELTASPRAASAKCLSARRAVAYYRAQTHRRQSARGGVLSDRTPIVRGKTCRWARYAAKMWIARARASLKALERWQDEWAWERWLPAKFYRVARCETGVRWDWDSGTYVSAFGIIRVAYEWYHPWTGRNSPREQYEVASAIQARFGWGAWGCGGA